MSMITLASRKSLMLLSGRAYPELGFGDAPVRRAEHDVFLHGQTRKNPPTFGHVRDAEPDNGFRPKPREGGEFMPGGASGVWTDLRSSTGRTFSVTYVTLTPGGAGVMRGYMQLSAFVRHSTGPSEQFY